LPETSDGKDFDKMVEFTDPKIDDQRWDDENPIQVIARFTLIAWFVSKGSVDGNEASVMAFRSEESIQMVASCPVASRFQRTSNITDS
jgi:hypothetical protein